MPAEDFAFFSMAVPSAFLFLGIGNEAAGSTVSLHSPAFRVDEEVLHRGAALHAALALTWLRQGGWSGVQ